MADEPTGSLDRKTANEIFSLFLKLKSKNRSILYATHNRELANKADYKLNILDGNITRKNQMKLYNKNQFTHFKIHTQYSICEGAIKTSDLAKDYCKKNKIKSNAGLSDSNNLCGALEFLRKY